MSRNLKKPSAVKDRELRPDRPFDPRILKRARDISRTCTIVLQPDPKLGYLGRSVEFPYAMDDGRTPGECVRKTRQALVAVVATMLEQGQVPPAPAIESNRSEQVNIRLTAEEKFLLEETARARGFRGLSDYMRATALAGAR